MTIIIAIIIATLIQLVYFGLLGVSFFALIWVGWQAFTKGSIPTRTVGKKPLK